MANQKISRKLELLQKISNRKSDSLRLEISHCLENIDMLNREKDTLIATYLQEERLSASGDAAHHGFALTAYRIHHIHKCTTITNRIQAHEKRYAELQDMLRELFAEQKAYDIAIERLKNQQHEDAKQAERAFMDEISTQGHYRQQTV